MNTIQNLFQQAQLAEAAYADLTTAIGSQSNMLTALNVANKNTYGGSFSIAQATAFTTQHVGWGEVRTPAFGGALLGFASSPPAYEKLCGDVPRQTLGS